MQQTEVSKKTILILAANPKDTPRLRLDEEVREIEEGLKRSEYRDQFEIKSRWAVRPRDLRRALLDENPHIVHFCGHGQTEGLQLEDDAGNASSASAGALAGLFEQFKDSIECVLLNACYSEVQANAIRQHIKYVIGMKNAISDKAALEFAIGFYDALGAGRSYESAFEFGRNATEFVKANSQNILPILKKRGAQEIEFINRQQELQYLTTIFAPQYLLISAPKGYGKTRLLESVKAKLQAQALYLHLSLSREQSYSEQDLAALIHQQIHGDATTKLDLKAVAEEVCRWIVSTRKASQRQVILFIDEAEALTDTVARSLFNEFIPMINEGLKNIAANRSIQVRLICVGRYISYWERNGFDIPLTSFSLTPFDFSAVHETVERYDSMNKFSQGYKKDFAAHLMYFTGGHPGCMATILGQDFGYPINRLISKEDEYHEFVVTPAIDEIKKHLSEELKPIFDTLSVVRRFNGHLLNHLIQSGLLPWSKGDGYVLEDRLKEAYLVSAKEDGFSSDDITRRLFAIHLRHTDFQRYQEVCQQAIAFYEAELKDPTSPNPAILSVELLFQKLQSLSEQPQSDPTPFFGYVAQIFDLWKSARARHVRQIAAAFRTQLENDWELRFMLNYLLRVRVYNHDHPFQELMEKLSHFQQSL